MPNPAQHSKPSFGTFGARPQSALMLICALVLLGTTGQAQTFSVLYNFTGGADGGRPYAGVTLDRSGNLYGTAWLGGNQSCNLGGDNGCGTVFKVSRRGTGWTFDLLYSFSGGADGWWPLAPVTVGSDGTVFGTTNYGGSTGCFAGEGCGTVFQLHPPPTFCRSVLCPWTKTQVYEFTGGLDGGAPLASLTFDAAGNIYSTTSYAQGNQYYGSVYELSPSNHGWTITVLHTFTDYAEGGGSEAGVVFDQQGNLWGSTLLGGADDCYDPQLPDPCGILFELTPSGTGWNYRSAYQFQQSVGGGPTGALIFDQSGNLYGTLFINGASGNGGVYQYNPFSGQETTIYSVAGYPDSPYGPQGGVLMDSAGNLYGVDPYDGPYSWGYVFKLSPSNGGWTFTDLHDFTGGSDGAAPFCTLAVDENGNIYGTTNLGGAHGQGAVFKITP
ncbi:MAG: choice-of-anchor tandem repeat GloVer-containing protein [Candidatus Korobacteraceae bacterium]